MLALVVSGAVWAANASILASRRKYPGRRKGPFGCKRAGSDAAELCESAANDPAYVEGYQVTTNTNRCLQCHGVEAIAPLARRASVLLTLWTATQSGRGSGSTSLLLSAMSRAAADTAPIVGNTFTPSKGYGK